MAVQVEVEDALKSEERRKKIMTALMGELFSSNSVGTRSGEACANPVGAKFEPAPGFFNNEVASSKPREHKFSLLTDWSKRFILGHAGFDSPTDTSRDL